MKLTWTLFISLLGVAAVVGGAVSAQTDPRSGLEPAGPKKIHSAQIVDGGAWTFHSFTNARGHFCFSRRVPSEGTGTTCIERGDLFKGREVFAVHGARVESSRAKKLEWDNMWVQGFVSPAVASLEIVGMDCSADPVTFDREGAFLYVVSRAKIKRDDVPYKLIAYSSTGDVVHEQDIATDITPNAKEAGLRGPKPKSSCA
jgi:hypothetical protein